MGFLEGLGRFAQGKPIFEAPVDSASHQAANNAQDSGSQVNDGPKVIPRVEVEQIDVHQNGNQMRISADIKNNSDVAVEIDKIRLLGTKREIDRVLKPHEQFQIVVYEGPRTSNRNYDYAWLDYKDLQGDYFQQYHLVEFEQESDNTYSVKRIRSSGPVKDI